MLYSSTLELTIAYCKVGHVRNRGINGDGGSKQGVLALYYSGGSNSKFDVVLAAQRYIAAECIFTTMTQASVNSMRGDESPFYTFAYSV